MRIDRFCVAVLGLIILGFSGCTMYEYRQERLTEQTYIENGYVKKPICEHWWCGSEWAK